VPQILCHASVTHRMMRHVCVQVEAALARLLPEVLLASLQLTYLGALPAAAAQHLNTSWAAALAQATGLDAQPGCASAAAAAAPGLGAGLSTQAPAAALQHPITATWANLLQLQPQQQLALPASVLMQDARSLDSTGLLAQQLQVAVAAVEVACQPVLAVDPLGLLPDVLGVGDASGETETVGQTPNSSSSSSGGWVVVRPDTASEQSATAAADAAATALAGGRSVCLRLHSLTAGHAALITRLVAAWHATHLQQQTTTSTTSSSTSSGGTVSATEQAGKAACQSAGSSSAGRAAGAALAAAAAVGIPRLVVHVGGPCATVPAQPSGLLSVVTVGSVRLHVSEVVQRQVLPLLDRRGWRASLAAVQAAEAAQWDAAETEALLLQHVAQVRCESLGWVEGLEGRRDNHSLLAHCCGSQAQAVRPGSVCLSSVVLCRSLPRQPSSKPWCSRCPERPSSCANSRTRPQPPQRLQGPACRRSRAIGSH
jgi:hypothetical protein